MDARPAADLRRLAECLAGYRIDGRAGSIPLEPAVARREEQELRAKYPAEFAASPTQVRAWHEREGADAEQAREWAVALLHLDALLAANPAQADLHSGRGKAHGELGHWEAAVRDYRQATEQAPEAWPQWFSLALAQLATGDTSGHEQSCAVLLTRFQRPNETYLIAAACVAAPGAVTDAAQLVAWIEGRDNRILGWALYRAGRWEEAVQRLTEAIPALGEGDPTRPIGGLFLAMAHARLGHAAEAREWLAKATAWMDESMPRFWQFRVMLSHLRREAEALLLPADPR
jgi:tetratricopeptide (TPR) repeat protein